MGLGLLNTGGLIEDLTNLLLAVATVIGTVTALVKVLKSKD
ncbi:conserved protein of unknown function [Vibrio tapetis subsp. tapetis]|uniref:Uncharacterized protein n=1 Tax=Vibrio tapetis subsp. tapetis TaxID=1671868 RepID=A0A2N8ZN75_9VIBR|nr:conserved protein of unknown function [Vibrio tapetis subsp. tapetis]